VVDGGLPGPGLGVADRAPPELGQATGLVAGGGLQLVRTDEAVQVAGLDCPGWVEDLPMATSFRPSLKGPSAPMRVSLARSRRLPIARAWPVQAATVARGLA